MSQLVTRKDGVKQVLGRKKLLTPEFQDAFCETLSRVRYITVAAEHIGIHPQTIQVWLRAGEKHILLKHPDGSACDEHCSDDDAAFRSFTTTVKQVRANSIQKSLDTIENHSVTNWQAAAWTLERTRPDLFALRTKNEVTGAGGGPIIHKVITTEQKKRMIEAAKEEIELSENEDGVFEATDDFK